jgi:TPR repeat protein
MRLYGKGRFGALFCFWLLLSSGAWAQSDKAALRELLAAGRFAELDAQMSAYQATYARGESDDDRPFQALVALTAVDTELRPAYDRWVAQYPSSYAARLARGYYLSGMGWAARGQGYLRDTPSDRLEEMRGYFREAMEDLKASVALDARPVLSYATMIRVARADRRFGDIGLYLENALALDPKAYHARMSYLLGIRPEWGGSLEQMERFVAQSRQALPAEQAAKLQRVLDNAVARDALAPGEQYAARGEYEEAVQHYEDVLAKQPSPRGYAARGYAYMRMKRHDKAIADFDRALELDPDDQCCGNTHSNRGYSYLESGALPKALPDLVHAAEQMDSHWAVRTLVGIYAYGHYGARIDLKRAHPWCERAARQGDAWSMFCLAHIYRTGWGGTQRDLAKGTQWMQRAAERGIAGAQYNLGWIYWEGEADDAWNPFKAFYWWSKAALQGDRLAFGRVLMVAVAPVLAMLLGIGLWLVRQRRKKTDGSAR